MSDYLLPELWPKILLKLPIKSLIQCTSVCKQWHSIITDHSFISTHLSLSRQNPLLLNTDSFSLTFDTNPLELSQNFHCPFPTYSPQEPFRVVGSVNGLILLSDDLCTYTNTMIIWNPSIQKSIKLPMPLLSFDEVGPYKFMLGFGFNSTKNDYKVVRVVYVEVEDDFLPLAEVYSVMERCWRLVSTANLDYHRASTLWTQCFVHEAVHWIGWQRDQEDDHLHYAILVFDVSNEVFKNMKLPESLASLVNEFVFPCSLAVIGGLLSVIHVHNWNSVCSDVSIWMKRDYASAAMDSWTKMLTLDLRNLDVGVFLHLRNVGGEILMETSGAGGDESGYNCKDLQLPPMYLGPEMFSGFTYPESLVLLGLGSKDQDTRSMIRTKFWEVS